MPGVRPRLCGIDDYGLTPSMGKKIFIICGEESGDLHGAGLMRALRRRSPGLRFGGMGGEKMRAAGLDGIDSRELSVVGIVEVLEKLHVILRALGELKRRLASERPDCVVLIDFPDFNLRVAKHARKLGIPVVYYISPQVWAWRKGRVGKIAGLVDKMLVVFPFEEDIYRKAGVDVEYVGHPLADAAKCPLTKAEARAKLKLPDDAVIVSLLPGSRTSEVGRMLGPLLDAAALMDAEIKKSGREAVFVLPAAASIDDGFLTGELEGCAADLRVVRGEMYAALRASDAAVVTSGTATLETALIGTPMVIVYRMSPLSYRIGRALIKGVDRIGLPNIVAGRPVVTELIQDEATGPKIAAEILSIINDNARLAKIKRDYEELRKNLGRGGAADRAAAAILKLAGVDAPSGAPE